MIDFYRKGKPTPLDDLLRIYFLKNGSGGKCILKTVTGALLHITDALAKPAKKFVATLEPIQDLHGQDAPYPAGGGKNILKPDGVSGTNTGVTFTKNDDGTWTAVNAATGLVAYKVGTFFIENGKTYVLSGCPSGGSPDTYRLDVRANATSIYNGWVNNGTGALASYTATEDATLYVYLRIASGYNASGKLFKPMICLSTASEPTTFAPYSNICPITGHTGANIWDDPKYGGLIEWNQLIKTRTSRTINGLTFTRIDDNKMSIVGTCESTDNYTISTGVTNIAEHKIACFLGINSTSDYYLYMGGYSSAVGTDGVIFTAVTNVSVAIYIKNGASVNIEVYPQFYDLTVMFGEGNEPTTVEEFRHLFPNNFYPYNSGTITTVSAVNGDPYRYIEIEFPDAAGTVYGGTLDVVSGKLVVTHKTRTYNHSPGEGWFSYGAGESYFCAVIVPQDKKTGNQKSICNEFKNQNGAFGSSDYGIYCDHPNLKNTYFRMPNSSVTTLEEFQTWIEAHPIQLCYELDEPIEYTLSESQALTLLKGENVVWCDNSDDLELQYYAKAEETP